MRTLPTAWARWLSQPSAGIHVLTQRTVSQIFPRGAIRHKSFKPTTTAPAPKPILSPRKRNARKTNGFTILAARRSMASAYMGGHRIQWALESTALCCERHILAGHRRLLPQRHQARIRGLGYIRSLDGSICFSQYDLV
jgi:hypothetical protein